MDQKIDTKWQNNQYSFPYHYIPQEINRSYYTIDRLLFWGVEYLSYTNFIIEKICSLKIRSVLDIGCGDGRLINLLKDKIKHIEGHDLNKKAVSFATAFNPEIQFHTSDLSNLTNAFDCVTLIETLEHIPQKDILMLNKHLEQLVKNNGYLLISVPTRNIPLTKKHYRHYTKELLREHISDKFKLFETNYIFKLSLRSKIHRFLMSNRLFTLNSKLILKMIYRSHLKHNLHADENNGSHLIALFRKH